MNHLYYPFEVTNVRTIPHVGLCARMVDARGSLVFDGRVSELRKDHRRSQVRSRESARAG